MYDLKIVNGLMATGAAGEKPQPGTLAVKDGRIAALGAEVSGAARQVLDAQGSVVCPGFIDLHTHCLAGLNENYLQSGVTLVVGGNCGFSPLNMARVAADCTGKCGPNLAMLIGHNNVRMEAMGNVNRKPSAREMGHMRAQIDRAMLDGAIGFSSGLTYVPGNYAETGELVDLARAAAVHGEYYASHMREEGAGLLDSIRETVEIGRASGLPAHVSHLKARGSMYWGMQPRSARLAG